MISEHRLFPSCACKHRFRGPRTKNRQCRKARNGWRVIVHGETPSDAKRLHTRAPQPSETIEASPTKSATRALAKKHPDVEWQTLLSLTWRFCHGQRLGAWDRYFQCTLMKDFYSCSSDG